MTTSTTEELNMKHGMEWSGFDSKRKKEKDAS